MDNKPAYWQGEAGESYVDRGDLAVPDFVVGDFVTDGTWRTLDLSGIVPAAAADKLVHFRLKIRDDQAQRLFELRRTAGPNVCNVVTCYIQAANYYRGLEAWVRMDGRTIQYKASSTVWSTIDLSVAGWMA